MTDAEITPQVEEQLRKPNLDSIAIATAIGAPVAAVNRVLERMQARGALLLSRGIDSTHRIVVLEGEGTFFEPE